MQQITVRITHIFFLEMVDLVGHQVAVPEQPVLLQSQVVIIKPEVLEVLVEVRVPKGAMAR